MTMLPVAYCFDELERVYGLIDVVLTMHRIPCQNRHSECERVDRDDQTEVDGNVNGELSRGKFG